MGTCCERCSKSCTVLLGRCVNVIKDSDQAVPCTVVKVAMLTKDVVDMRHGNTALADGHPKMMEKLVQRKTTECGLHDDLESRKARIRRMEVWITEAVQLVDEVK